MIDVQRTVEAVSDALNALNQSVKTSLVPDAVMVGTIKRVHLTVHTEPFGTTWVTARANIPVTVQTERGI